MKTTLAAGGAGRGGQALADDLGGLQRVGVELRVQQGVELLGLHAQDGLFLGRSCPRRPGRTAIFSAAAAVRLPLRVCSM